MLKFSYTNSKINELANMLGLPKKSVIAFDLPAGYTCPMADKCKAYAHKVTGKITDGKDIVFRCYAASSECAFTSVRKLRWHNYDLLLACKSIDDMTTLILSSLPDNVKIIRIHSSGDFYNQDYFTAWANVAKIRSDIVFFGYTKVMPYVTADKPDNFKLVYSHGGKMDNLITETLPVAYVVKTPAHAGNLPVACQNHPADDFIMVMKQISFALALHGTQPAKA